MSKTANYFHAVAGVIATGTAINATVTTTNPEVSDDSSFEKAINTCGIPIAFTLMTAGIVLDVCTNPDTPIWKKIAAGAALAGLAGVTGCAIGAASDAAVPATLGTALMGTATACFAAMNLTTGENKPFGYDRAPEEA